MNYDNKPVAWMYEDASGTMKMLGNTRLEEWVTKFGCKEISLYTHPAKTDDEPNWKEMYWEMHELNHKHWSELKAHPAKTLTDEEIKDIGYQHCEFGLNIPMIRAILRKAQE